MPIKLKRVYETPDDSDGARILVDRLWPRGIAKDKARIDLWLKDIAPSNALRQRFHGKPDDWDEFCASYFSELQEDAPRVAAMELFNFLQKGPITLIYAARNEDRNNAAALKQWLEKQLDE